MLGSCKLTVIDSIFVVVIVDACSLQPLLFTQSTILKMHEVPVHSLDPVYHTCSHCSLDYIPQRKLSNKKKMVPIEKVKESLIILI